MSDKPIKKYAAGVTRRAFLVTAAGAAFGLSGHEASPTRNKLYEHEFNIPSPPYSDSKEQYKKCYNELEASIQPAAEDLVKISRQFGFIDVFNKYVKEGCHMTIKPPYGHTGDEGTCEFKMCNEKDCRTGKLPAFNRMIRACIDIQLLDEKYHTEKNDRLDYGNVASKLINRIELPPLLNAEKIQQDCTDILRAVSETAAAFERPEHAWDGEKLSRDNSSEKSMGPINIDVLPFYFTIQNPTLEIAPAAAQFNTRATLSARQR